MANVSQAANQTAHQAVKETNRVVGEHPLPSALTAFGVGFGVGFLGAALLQGLSGERSAALTDRVLDTVSNAMHQSVGKHLS